MATTFVRDYALDAMTHGVHFYPNPKKLGLLFFTFAYCLFGGFCNASDLPKLDANVLGRDFIIGDHLSNFQHVNNVNFQGKDDYSPAFLFASKFCQTYGFLPIFKSHPQRNISQGTPFFTASIEPVIPKCKNSADDGGSGCSDSSRDNSEYDGIGPHEIIEILAAWIGGYAFGTMLVCIVAVILERRWGGYNLY
jgi:hypothetical protein